MRGERLALRRHRRRRPRREAGATRHGLGVREEGEVSALRCDAWNHSHVETRKMRTLGYGYFSA